MKLVKIFLFVTCFVFTSHLTAQTVYTTKTGEKYHKAHCKYLKYSKKEIILKKAKEFGYTACSVCKPNTKNTKISSSSALTNNSNYQTTTKKTTATQCTGKTKSGSRCKRRTKNANGRCYQH
ncbi:hypothetical protein [Algibacter sp. 2305UL17-15]|uniref:hypothetical protein n=1 Tax=Algibacter sp. 2305UL17-15 TaxID=3231268 RepID=UPI0034579DC5